MQPEVATDKGHVSPTWPGSRCLLKHVHHGQHFCQGVTHVVLSLLRTVWEKSHERENKVSDLALLRV